MCPNEEHANDNNLETNKIKKREYISNYPISNEEEYSQYIYAINSKIDDKNIRNIGIVAPYGAGKSSIVKSYFDKNPDKKRKSKTISLASFSRPKDNGGGVSNTSLNTKELERIEKSILEQIIYKRKYCPFSRSNLSRVHSRIIFAIIFAFVLTASIVFTLLSILELNKSLLWSNGEKFYWFMGFAIGSVALLVFMLQYVFKVRKIAVENIEVELEDNSSVSVLNKFIDEMINFCFETKIKYFVFEDIDRFNSPELLLKLREINFLINESDYITDPVVFIYCVKDSVFKRIEDKYKFFDFVLSPLPIFNSDIAADEVKSLIDKNKDPDLDLDEVSLREMTRYVTDIRVLHGIVNDYLLYKDKLNIKREENEKLFAMMIYKNLSFEDFSELQENRGLLYDVFHDYKETALASLSKDLNEKLNDAHTKLEETMSTDAINGRFAKLRTEISNLIVEKGKLSSGRPAGCIDNNSLTTYKNVQNGLYVRVNQGYYPETYKYLSLAEIAPYLEGNKPFDEETRINKESVGKIQNEIDVLKQSIIVSREKSASDLFLEGWYLHNNQEKVENNRFLYMALRNNYINESYFKYCSRKLSETDDNFIDSVINKEKVDPSLRLDSPQKIVSKLSMSRFQTPSVLNYSLVDFVLHRKNDFPSKEETLIKYLSFREEKTKQFLCDYFKNGNEIKLLLSELKKQKCDNLISDLINCDDGENAVVSIIQTLSLEKTANPLIYFYNKDNILTKFLEDDNHIIERYYSLFANSNDYLNFLSKFGVKSISCIDDTTTVNNVSMSACFEALFKSNLLEINPHNLQIITKAHYKKDVIETSDFIESKDDTIRSYYSNNLEKTISSIIECSFGINDSDETINKILRDDNIDVNLLKLYIQKLGPNSIQNIKDLNQELYSTIIESNSFVFNYDNLSYLYSNNKMSSEELSSFISNNLNQISGKIADKNMLIDVLNSAKISTNDLKSIVKFTDLEIGISEINDDEKRASLINLDKILVDDNSLSHCKGMRLSVYACLKKKISLASQLSNVFTISDFDDLFVSNELSGKTKVIIANQFYSLFTSKLSANSINQIYKAVKTHRSKSCSKEFIYWLISSVTDEQEKNFLSNQYGIQL